MCRPAIDLVVIAEGEAEAAVKAELAEETGLVEDDLVAVSYMGDELDLETVGDIIAIIEEKVHRLVLACGFPSDREPNMSLNIHRFIVDSGAQETSRD